MPNKCVSREVLRHFLDKLGTRALNDLICVDLFTLFFLLPNWQKAGQQQQLNYVHIMCRTLKATAVSDEAKNTVIEVLNLHCVIF